MNEANQRLGSYSGRISALFREARASVKENGVPSGVLRIGSLEHTLAKRLPPIWDSTLSAIPRWH